MKSKKIIFVLIVLTFFVSSCRSNSSSLNNNDAEINTDSVKTGDEIVDQAIDDAVEMFENAIENSETKNFETNNANKSEKNKVYQLEVFADLLDEMNYYLNEGIALQEDESLSYEYSIQSVSTDLRNIISQFKYNDEKFYEETVDVPDFNMSTTTLMKNQENKIFYDMTAITMEDDEFASQGDLVSKIIVSYNPENNIIERTSAAGELMEINNQIYIDNQGNLYMTFIQTGWLENYQAIYYDGKIIKAYTIDTTEDITWGIDFNQKLPNSFEDLLQNDSYTLLFSYDGSSVVVENNR